MKKILLSALAIVAMAGCDQDKPAIDGLPDKQIEVRSNVIASKSITQDGDVFNLQYIRDDKATQTWDGVLTNTTHDASNRITFTEKYLKDNTNSYFKFFSDGGTQGADVDKTKITWTLTGAEDIVYNPTAWDAGNYNAPITSGLKLEHMLTRIEVVLQGKQGEDIGNITSSWGNITNIKIAGLSDEITYDYAAASNAITYGTVAANATDALALLGGNTYNTTYTPAAIGANANTTVVAGIILPDGVNTTTAKLYISANGTTDQEVPITFGAAIQKGKINTITLTFSAKDKNVSVGSTVEEWLPGTTGSGSL